MSKVVKKEIDFADRKLSLETGNIAFQASGAVLARYGETGVLVTATSAEPREDMDFFPLRVDYEERLYAGGLIKTSRFVKREGRPSDESVLACRLVDRAIRPLFSSDFFNEVQVVATVLSVDNENDPEILSLIGASAALAISDIPWNGPLGAVRVGLKNGQFILNPKNGDLKTSALDLVVAGSREKILMVEAVGKEIPEERILEAIKFGHGHLKAVLTFIEDFAKEAGVNKQAYESKTLGGEILNDVRSFGEESLKQLVMSQVDKIDYVARFAEIEKETHKEFEGKYTKSDMTRALMQIEREIVRSLILDEKKRPDGRQLTEVRPVSISVGVFPRTHGSALFTRGLTQSLTIATLGSTSLEQLIQSMEGEETKRYIHHYNAPPYSVGEIEPMRGPGRREIGHGALAEKALEPMIPKREGFPYTIRLVSEILSQNGSTSMAATCGSSLALMDAGVPTSRHVAGVAMGLIERQQDYVILSDIAGVEDSSGDMDFKIAGSREGITAIQLDVKNAGLSMKIIEEVLSQSQQARKVILDKMEEVLPAPRKELSKYAPRITQMKVDQKRIGEIIGSGGRIIKGIIEKTGVDIDIEEDGTVYISSTDEIMAGKARLMIEALIREVKVGEIFEGKVTRIADFGVFVEILPNKEGLIHISELSHRHVGRTTDLVKVGDILKVKVIEIDTQGRINLSKKALERVPPLEPGGKEKPLGYRTPYYRRPGYRR